MVEHGHGRQLDDDYELDTQLWGEGGFGTVRRARPRMSDRLTGPWQRAVKAVKKCNRMANGFVKKEVAILRGLDHPCICRLMETFEDNIHHYLVMEFIEGQELFDFLNALKGRSMLPSEPCAAGIMRQVFSALQYCHERRIIHRDLKPENIMIKHDESSDQIEVKLIDFGLATLSQNDGVNIVDGGLCGTEQYMAPEVRRRGKFTTAADMWSAGLVLYTLLFGDLPNSAICSGTKPVDGGITGKVSDSASELLRGVLDASASQRWSAAKACKHAWCQDTENSGQPLSAKDSEDIVRALIAFEQSSHLQRAAKMVLAKQLTSQNTQMLRKHFLCLDQDADGKIAREEIVALIQHCHGVSAADRARAEEIFASIDSDSSGFIEYTEWVGAALQEIDVSDDADYSEAIWTAFNIFDVQRNGHISPADLGTVLQADAEDLPAFSRYDTNGDGVLDFSEFKAMLFPTALAPDAVVIFLDDATPTADGLTGTKVSL